MKFRILRILLLMISICSIENASKEANNLLINDLNIIATKIDEIPETNLNLKLVVLAYHCNDIKLNWKIQNNSKKSALLATKIFGFQVVVREYLEQSSKKNQTSQDNSDSSSEEGSIDKHKDKAQRVYSSKFIDSTQNKFKLINLLRKDQASYLICLIIYIDVTETVAFEKQCVNFSLPPIASANDTTCSKANSKKGSRTKSTTTLTSVNPFTKIPLTTENMKIYNSTLMDELNTISQREFTLNHFKPSKTNILASTYNCEHVSQCRHYSNLLIAFVVCGVLLGTNVFMFTIIIIQNTIKLGLLRQKIQASGKKPFQNNTSPNFLDKESEDKTFFKSERDLSKLGCCSCISLRTAIRHSCSDIISAICCGTFRNKERNISNRDSASSIRKYDNYCGSTVSDLRIESSINQSCTTITRPGYILQVPNTTLSSASILNITDKAGYFTRGANLLNQVNHKQNKRKNLIKSGSHTQGRHQPSIDDQNQSSSSTESNLKSTDNTYSNEIFYHVPSKLNESQISSAF